MAKTTGKKLIKVEFKSIVMVVLALAFGFICGVLYYRHHINSASSNKTTSTSPVICSCPDMRVGSNPANYCDC